jgi:hypothetical protein
VTTAGISHSRPTFTYPPDSCAEWCNTLRTAEPAEANPPVFRPSESEAFTKKQQPLGPEIEYADQRTDEPIELRVHRGSDGGFELLR